MFRTTTHIAFVLLLGLYFNSVPVAWLAYSTFAEKAFAAHCVNPGKPSCHGKCQIISMQAKAEKSGKPQALAIQFAQIHPSLLFSLVVPDVSRVGEKIVWKNIISSVRQGITPTPFHPPRLAGELSQTPNFIQ
ncbi:MAG: hypothetical protein ACHQM6_02190 [Candidatus Kapaibacterium sp.]